MKASVTLAFTALFGVVAYAYFRLTPSEVEVQKMMPEAPRQLLKIEEDDELTWIQIQNRDQADKLITLQKEGGRWMLKYPITYPANPMIVEGLASALTFSRTARRLVREKGWEEYGLLKPEIKIGIETRKNSDRRYLSLGDASPVGDFVFARWEDETEYFLLNADMKKAFARSVYSLRLKNIFRYPMNEVRKIRFQLSTEEFEMARHDAQWFWMEPIPVLGEVIAKEDVDRILSQLMDLYIKEFLDDEKRERSELGFALLGRSVKVWGPDEKGSELVLGGSVPTKDGIYGVLEGEGAYFLVAQSNVDALFQTVQGLAERHLAGTEKKENLLS